MAVHVTVRLKSAQADVEDAAADVRVRDAAAMGATEDAGAAATEKFF